MQKDKFTFRPAFSMLELVFVIVILGIVSSIGAEIIAKVYENYIVQRAIHRSSLKTDLTATQIANRLTYAIPNTVIARLNDSNFIAIEDAIDKTYNKLEWIAYDADSFGYTGTPGWSGFCDVNASSINTVDKISTPGSDLNQTAGHASTVISNLSGSLTDAAILFPGLYNVNTVGFDGGISDAGVAKIASTTDTTITFHTGPAERTFREHYKLAWTAYAVVPTKITNTTELINRGFDSNATIYDLSFHYDYQPWEGESYHDATDSLLIRNVSVFNFKGTGDTIRFKLCIQENIGQTYPITICKERAVIR